MDPFLGNMRPFKSTCSLGNQSQHGSHKHLGRLHVGAFIYVMELPNDGSFMLRMENVDVRYCLKLPVTEGFNWYRDGSDWKPFHHDAAALNPRMAEKQNCDFADLFGPFVARRRLAA